MNQNQDNKIRKVNNNKENDVNKKRFKGCSYAIQKYNDINNVYISQSMIKFLYN